MVKYKELWDLLDKRQTDLLAKKILNREKEISQALFYTKDENDNYLKTFFDKFGKEEKKMKPLENYKMVFMVIKWLH